MKTVVPVKSVTELFSFEKPPPQKPKPPKKSIADNVRELLQRKKDN